MQTIALASTQFLQPVWTLAAAPTAALNGRQTAQHTQQEAPLLVKAAAAEHAETPKKGPFRRSASPLLDEMLESPLTACEPADAATDRSCTLGRQALYLGSPLCSNTSQHDHARGGPDTAPIDDAQCRNSQLVETDMQGTVIVTANASSPGCAAADVTASAAAEGHSANSQHPVSAVTCAEGIEEDTAAAVPCTRPTSAGAVGACSSDAECVTAEVFTSDAAAGIRGQSLSSSIEASGKADQHVTLPIACEPSVRTPGP